VRKTQNAERRIQNPEGQKPTNPGKNRGDFVRFRLRRDAPNFVAFGGARFSGVFARAQEPFEVTRGEWKVFFERTGFFEELTGLEVGSGQTKGQHPAPSTQHLEV
jgi:hypothetical protein